MYVIKPSYFTYSNVILRSLENIRYNRIFLEQNELMKKLSLRGKVGFWWQTKSLDMIYDKKIHIFLIYVIFGLSMHASTNHRRDHLLEGFGAIRKVN